MEKKTKLIKVIFKVLQTMKLWYRALPRVEDVGFAIKMRNAIITLLSLLRVKQGIIISIDYLNIYTKCLLQITSAAN
jgi:hypothetical protein